MPLESLHERAQKTPGYNAKSLPIDIAQRLIEDSMQPVTGEDTVPLMAALGRVLVHDIISPIDVPPHDNSAMDGYALRGQDLSPDAPMRLKSVGTILAGQSDVPSVEPGQCVRIMTGGVMPAGSDTVVPQELVHLVEADTITLLPGTVSAGDNRRLCGEDLQNGTPALRAGRRLRPSDLGLLASLGIAKLTVRRRVKVAFFSTGDELRSLDQHQDPGTVFDANRYTLHGMLTRLGCELVDLGLVPDKPDALCAAFQRGCAEADVVITSGGVSVGEADHTKQVMAQLGEVMFWTIAMRPGRPLAFGNLHYGERHTPVFGLPGNPVAVMVTFYFLVRAALQRCMGEEASLLPRVKVQSTDPIRKKAGRTEYQRALLRERKDGQPVVQVTGAQGSGVLSSMSAANCMIVLEHARGDVAAGEMVDVVLFEGLV